MRGLHTGSISHVSTECHLIEETGVLVSHVRPPRRAAKALVAIALSIPVIPFPVARAASGPPAAPAEPARSAGLPDRARTAGFVLPAPRITVTPTAISKFVRWRGRARATLTIENTGTVPVTVRLTERSDGFSVGTHRGVPLRKVRGDYRPERTSFGPVGAAKSSGAGAVAGPVAEPWAPITGYPTPIRENVAASGGGKVYSVSGVDAERPTAQGYVYDPTARAWSPIASMRQARHRAQGAMIDGRFYVVGGYASDGPLASTMEIYDPKTDEWSAGASMPEPYAGAGTAVLDGKMYLVGGCNEECGSTAVQVYDPSADSWSAAAAYPERTSWLACGAINGDLYCAGGTSGRFVSRHAYSYSPVTDSWTPIPDLPTDLWGMGYTTSGGQLLVSGGVTDDSGAVTNQGFAYTPGTSTWSALPNSNNTVYWGGSTCGFYRIGGAAWPQESTTGAEVLPGYNVCDDSTDVAWMSTNKTQVTIRPGKRAKVIVKLNARVSQITQPGTYTAKLIIDPKTPYGARTVPVSLTVTRPT